MPVQGVKNARRVTVLGAGIVGIFCVLSLQERGFRVTLIDRHEPGEGASHGNAGVISPWSCVPQCLPGIPRQVSGWLLQRDGPIAWRWRDLPRTTPWAMRFLANCRRDRVETIADAMDRLMQGNVDAYRRFLHGTGQKNLLLDSWYVNVFRGSNRPSLDDLAWKLRIERNAPVDIVEGGALLEIEPALDRSCHSAIIIRDQARAASPGRLTKVLAEQAAAMGAVLIRTEVRAIEPRQAGYALVTPSGCVMAERLVVAGGYQSAALLAPLGLSLPLMAERGYHMEFAEPGVALNHSIADVEGKFVVSFMEDGLRAAGTAEFARHDAPPNMHRAHMLVDQTKRLLPSLNAEPATPWMGVRPSVPNNLPAIGAVLDRPGLFAAFGHSHYGMGMAPATGRPVAEMVEGTVPNIPMTPYATERFGRSVG